MKSLLSYTITAALAATLALAGCGSKKDPEKHEPATGSAVVTPPPATGSAAVTPPATGSAVVMSPPPPATGSADPAAGSAAAGPVDVPTEEDFEAKAKTDITTATVDAKVKAIEDQLGQQ